ncbi:pyridoxine 5'-phosphate synthase [Halobacteriovorax marinus]|mgnify:CR=1 FL=1|uniref:Pyridoxine 5'-phosphate synthase n=1 Tax=Halobacteriovorax marinus TaxID=97084 RepID=A0A1Y5FD50_9BACT|nr:pyridoxine 5'-phosphate synthase [Halobacteriovorax marinus]
MKTRLGVNIDHVATLRQARGEGYPSIVEAAKTVLQEGADQITIHLREDRRHIQDTDVEAVHLVTKKFGKPLNLEMGCNDEIVEIAIATAPDWICLVPEKREEKTTEGGLDLISVANFEKIQKTCTYLKSKLPSVKISLFLEASQEVLLKASTLPIDAVEVHTGDYAKAHLNDESYDEFISQFLAAKKLLVEKNINCHAGHGLTQQSLIPLLEKNIFEEYNIGHWIICQALFEGLGPVVKKMSHCLSDYPYTKED